MVYKKSPFDLMGIFYYSLIFMNALLPSEQIRTHTVIGPSFTCRPVSSY